MGWQASLTPGDAGWAALSGTWQVLPVQLGAQLGLHQLLLVRLLLKTPPLKAPRLRELAGWLWGSRPGSTLSCLRKLGSLTLCPSIFVVSLEANLICSCPNNYNGGLDSTESACQAGDLGWEDSLEKGVAIHSNILA